MRRLLPVLLTLVFATVAQATSLMVPREADVPPLVLAKQHVEVIVDNFVALTKVDQVFRNNTGRQLEATYVFPLPNHAAVKAVEAMGLTVQRPLLRMGRGEPVREDLDLLWASSGPEKG